MSDEKDKIEVVRLGAVGIGSIDPDTRVALNEIDDQTIDRLAEDIDAHYVWIGNKVEDIAMLIPVWCVDGRDNEEDTPLAPNASGGSYSIVAGVALIDADALIVQEQTSASHGDIVFKDLIENGYTVGGHCDDHAEGKSAGCGACDKFGEIISYVATHIKELSTVAENLGVPVSEELQQTIARNAQNLIDAGYVSSGKEMVATIRSVAGDSQVQTLQGSHKEVLLVINTVDGTTLDRRTVAEQYGDRYQVFNLDTWALRNGIDAVSHTASEVEQKFVAAMLYNIATAAVLAGPSLRVRVL